MRTTTGILALDPCLHGRAVLFDLDDTIIDFTGNQEWAWQEACRAAAERVSGLDPLRLRETIRTVADWYWGDPVRHREGRRDLRAASAGIVRTSLERLGVAAPAALPRAVADHYRDLRDGGLALVDGATDLLAALRAAGTPLALVTNGTQSDQRAKLERFDLERHFDHIQIEGEFGAGKPEEPVYHAALAALGVPAERATFVGDNLEWDVAAPMRVGMQAVWVDVAGGGLPGGAAAPARVVRRVTELAARAT